MTAPAKVAVAHLIDHSGATHYFRSLARHHDAGRYALSVGSLEPAGSLQEQMGELGLGTFAMGVSGRRRYPLAVLPLARWLRGAGIDLLHLHTFYASVVGLAAARLARVPCVVATRHHSDHLLRLRRPLHHALDRWVTRGVDRVIAVSEGTRRIMVEREGADPAGIEVVHNGIEEVPPRDPERLRTLRRELGLGEGPVLVTVARLHEEKGHRHLFQALPSVLERAPGLRLLLAGDGEHRGALEAEAARLGLAPVVDFLGWRDDALDVLALADVMVLPSLAESFGFVVVEAMALGVPVVATTTGGVPEVLGDEAGLLVPPADPGALAGALLRLLADEGERRRAGEAGRRRAALFSARAMVRGYESVYASVFSGRGLDPADAPGSRR